MTNFGRQILNRALVWFDLVVFAALYLASAAGIWHLTAVDTFASFISMRVKLSNILLFAGLLCCWHVIFSAFGLYRSRRLEDRKVEIIDLLKAISVGALVLGIVGGFFRPQTITPVFIAVFWTLSCLILILCRLLIRGFLAWVRAHGRNLHQLVIVGTNPRAVEFADTIESKPELGYHLVGFADDEDWPGIEQFRKCGRAIVTDLRDFRNFLRVQIIDEVIIALPIKSFYSQAAQIVQVCQEQGVMVRVLASLFDFQVRGWSGVELDDVPVATFGRSVFRGWPLVCKRLLDIFVSSLLLVLLAPIFFIIALLIKIDSAGPAFFVQDRVGLSKRRFRMYKFRTMVEDAEKKQAHVEHLNEVVGPVFKIKNDPRVTRAGRFLRKTSIDELPQLLNVLKGEMSLVGPRPLALRDYHGLDEDWLRRRFSVRPGITCLWQINGRSSLPFQEWMELDLLYIDHWSFWLDLKLLAKTIPAVLKGVGAV